LKKNAEDKITERDRHFFKAIEKMPQDQRKKAMA